MGRPIAQHGGNDCVMTPIYLAQAIVDHFQPEGKVLEPCCGTGNFLQALPNADWYEVNKGRDFLTAIGHWDWIITNPPYSKYRDFLNKSMQVADNIVFLQLVNAIFYKARLRDLFGNGFGIKEIVLLDTPPEFPQYGFQFGCVYFKKLYKGSIKLTQRINYNYRRGIK